MTAFVLPLPRTTDQPPSHTPDQTGLRTALPMMLPRALPVFEQVATGDRFELVDRLGKDSGTVAAVIVRVNSGPVTEIEAADFIDALMVGNLMRLHSYPSTDKT